MYSIDLQDLKGWLYLISFYKVCLYVEHISTLYRMNIFNTYILEVALYVQHRSTRIHGMFTFNTFLFVK